MSEAKKEDFVGKGRAELLGIITEYKRELMNLRFQRVAGELKNVARFRQVRVLIARAYTEINKQKS